MANKKRRPPKKHTKKIGMTVQTLEAFQQTGLPMEMYEVSEEVTNRARIATHMGIQGEKTFQRIDTFMQEFSETTLFMAQIPLMENPTEPRPACRAGCHWCCHVRVMVSPVEVIRIINFLKKKLSSGEIDELHARIVEVDKLTRGMNDEDRASTRLFCPLLQNKRCSVYPVRPMSCQGHYSMDADKCQQDYENPDEEILVPFYAFSTMVHSATLAGIAKGFDDFGLESYPVELVAALRIGLETPNIIRKWLKGKEVFGFFWNSGG